SGMLYQEQPGGYISNIYNADITNKANITRSIILKAEDPDIKIKYIQAPGVITKGNDVKAVFFVLIPAKKIHSFKTDVKLQLISGGKVIQTITTEFVAPFNN